MKHLKEFKTKLSKHKREFLKSELDNTSIVRYIKLIFEEYNTALYSNYKYKDKLHTTTNEFFVFEKLNINTLDLHSITTDLSQHFTSSHQLFNSKFYKPFELTFLRCEFRQISTLLRRGQPLLNQIKFSDNCVIENLTIGSDASGPSHYAIILKDTSIYHTAINGHPSQNVRGEIKFLKCTFINSFKTFGRTEFSDKILFDGCIFKISPKFHGSIFHYDTSFQKSRFEDTSSDDAIGDYRVLKQLTDDIGADHDSMMFHALEMESRRNTVLPQLREFKDDRWVESVSSFSLKWINDYGRNFWLPFIWLLGFLSILPLFYYFSEIGCLKDYETKAPFWLQDICSAQDSNRIYLSYLYSLKYSLGPLGLIFDNNILSVKNDWGMFIAKAHLIISTIIWFIWILQIRRQFKL